MPLDGHSFLLSQGWSGKGTGLRQGAITRPITIAQKNNLGGLGKDRDEAYPFWDHLFTAASKAITVKIDNSDESDNESTSPVPILNRTSTGILSNRRPVDQSSTSTFCSSTPKPSSSAGPRLSLLAHAKREAAKRHLYSKFYRGIILAPDPDILQQPMVPTSTIHLEPSPISTCQPSLNNKEDVKRKWKPSSDDTGEDAERQERKRLKREKKARKESKKNERAKERVESKDETRGASKEGKGAEEGP